jgi:carbon storage regulator CsrA
MLGATPAKYKETLVMLVLSRGRNDKVVFPTLGISVEILRVAGNKVRLGIDAPHEVPVHRHEVSERMEANGEFETIKLPPSNNSAAAKLTHDMRNRLNAAALGLHLLHRNVETGDMSDAEATIFKIFNELKAIENELEAPTQSKPIARADMHHRALVVEDNDNERELLAGCLRAGGYDVDTAADGLQAMVRLTEKAPDVVLLDIHMPRFDGGKTISAIRNNPDYRGLKLFAVTGSRPEETDICVGPTGVDRWFVKPLNPNALLDALQADLCTERVLA